VERSIRLSGGDIVQVGISVGMAAYTSFLASADELLARADNVLYEAKRRSVGREKLPLVSTVV
jgi:predicted signal transduction protein with EAL and GGDEF domain